MSILKYYNSATSQWEPAMVAGQGPQGIQGIQGTNGALSPNYIINGGFDIWQRGTSFSNPAAWTGFTADRWLPGYDGSGATRTISQQAIAPGSISGIDLQYFYRYAQTVSGSGGTYNLINNRIEDARTLAGKVITLSFYAKAAASTTLPYIDMEQNFGTGGSTGDVTLITSDAVIGTSWNRYSYTFTLKSISGKTIGANSFVALRIQMPINATFTLDITGVQLEEGSVATAFRRNAPSIQAELAACQRYYYRRTASVATAQFGTGIAYNTTGVFAQVFYPVEMRIAPTAIESSGTLKWGNGISASNFTGASIPADTATTYSCLVNLTGATGLTSGGPVRFDGSAGAYVAFSAEL